MTTAYHVMPMMTSSSVAIALVAIIAVFALVGYACVRVGDDDEPYICPADEMRLLSIRSSKDSFSEVLRTVRRAMETNAKMGCFDYYKSAGACFCNDGELHYISRSMLKQIGDTMENDGFNVEFADEDTIRISW